MKDQGRSTPSYSRSISAAAEPSAEGTLLFNRMPRIQEPLPDDEIALPVPPPLPTPPRWSWFQVLLPLAGVFVLLGVYGGMRGDWRLGLPMLVMSGFSVLGSVAGRLALRRDARRRTEEATARYAALLAERQAELERLRAAQQRIRNAVDPDLDTVLARALSRDPRLWQRRPNDADFLHLRLGMGQLPSTVAVSAPHPDLPDPRLDEAQALEAEYVLLPNVPVTVDLRDGPLGVAGPPAESASLARALLCHLVAHHAPTEARLLAICPSNGRSEWRWLKWLPHTHALDDVVAFPPLASGDASVFALCDGLMDELHRRRNQHHAARHGGDSPAWPWLVVLVADSTCVADDPALHLLLSPEARALNATGLFLVDALPDVPAGCRAVVEIGEGDSLIYSRAGAAGETVTCRPDRAGVDLCDRLARGLAPLRARAARADVDLPTEVRLLDLLGIADVSGIDVAGHWRLRDPAQSLRVPIGLRQGGQTLWLDLKHTGHGPHGLVAGTTGSGKSELLQTLVVALALAHHPHDVGFVLVDFKGGGAFSGLVDLPHVQGVVTDLGGDLAGRALVSLRAEMDRRKRLFSEAGVNDIAPYQQLYHRGRLATPLPHLVVIVDEFAELVADLPDFIEGLIGVARIGRSLGVHLILATQSPAGVVKQQIWANARFRICLRVESRQESLEMLRRPDAAGLPRLPGRGYFQVGNDEVFDLFQVARVAGRYRPASAARPGAGNRIVIARVSPLGRSADLVAAGERPEEKDLRTDLEVVVERLAREAGEMGVEKLPSPWPAPLPAWVALPDLLRRTGSARWDGAGWGDVPGSAQGPLAVLGLLDDPARQRQVPLLLDLSQQDGHLVVVGAPGSGKSMWVRTLVMALAQAYPPDALHFHLLAFAGSSLRCFESLPHVGSVLAPLDDERVRRLLHRLLHALDERKRLCSEAGVASVSSFQQLRPGESLPAVVLLIAGFATFRTLFQDEMVRLTRLIREGGPYGIHVVLVGDRAGDIPLAISSVIARRIALRLADGADYGTLLGAQVRLHQDRPLPVGRGWVGRPPLAFQTACPVDTQDEGAQMAELGRVVRAMDAAWKGARPDAVGVLRSTIPLAEMLERLPSPAVGTAPRLAVPLGEGTVDLAPVVVDLARDGPHFLVAGTAQSGKSTLLLSWVLALAAINSPQEIGFMLISGRRDSLGALAALPHVRAYWRDAAAFVAAGGLLSLKDELGQRERSGGGGHLMVVVDDYDEVAGAAPREADLPGELARLAKHGPALGISLVVSGPLPNMGVGYGDVLVKQLKMDRSGFLLRVLTGGDQNPLGVRVRSVAGEQVPPGRGILVRGGREEMIQVATPGDAAAVAAWVRRLVGKGGPTTDSRPALTKGTRGCSSD